MQGGAIYADGSGGTVTITISDTEFKTNSAGDQVSEISRLLTERNLVTFPACPGGGNFNLQGGAIYAKTNGAKVEIYTSAFERNSAPYGVSEVSSSF